MIARALFLLALSVFLHNVVNVPKFTPLLLYLDGNIIVRYDVQSEQLFWWQHSKTRPHCLLARVQFLWSFWQNIIRSESLKFSHTLKNKSNVFVMFFRIDFSFWKESFKMGSGVSQFTVTWTKEFEGKTHVMPLSTPFLFITNDHYHSLHVKISEWMLMFEQKSLNNIDNLFRQTLCESCSRVILRIQTNLQPPDMYTVAPPRAIMHTIHDHPFVYTCTIIKLEQNT